MAAADDDDDDGDGDNDNDDDDDDKGTGKASRSSTTVQGDEEQSIVSTPHRPWFLSFSFLHYHFTLR
jgi:hypothetical protein